MVEKLSSAATTSQDNYKDSFVISSLVSAVPDLAEVRTRVPQPETAAQQDPDLKWLWKIPHLDELLVAAERANRKVLILHQTPHQTFEGQGTTKGYGVMETISIPVSQVETWMAVEARTTNSTDVLIDFMVDDNISEPGFNQQKGLFERVAATIEGQVRQRCPGARIMATASNTQRSEWALMPEAGVVDRLSVGRNDTVFDVDSIANLGGNTSVDINLE